MSKLSKISLCIFLLLFLNTSATHIRGSFNPNDFFKFIIKFGFQKTDRHSQRDSFGYIYGNITSKDTFPVNLTLAVLDKYSFADYYGNRSIVDKNKVCQQMFKKINLTAFDIKCHPQGKGDFLRKIPCGIGKLCSDEDSPLNVVPGNQFTYVISDLLQPR